ncbi:ComEC/Rec2 family competence protein [Actinomadura scrupuli]|uniref:ComEC/Rec2 family competence protein n=1 Tax=Actinomadura scrupuli TaxID=559629 RepID=UPI003D99EF9E
MPDTPGKREREEPAAPAPKRPKTRAQSAPGRQREAEAAAAAILAEQEALAAKRAKDLSDRPKPVAGNRGDGQLHVAFIRVGQGDCTVMSTPRGRVLLFDCGAKPKEGARPEPKETDTQFTSRLKAILNGPKFMKDHDVIDVLITTHGDVDHYNKLTAVLPDTVKIDNWYYSGSVNDYSEGATSSFIKSHLSKGGSAKEVVLNNDAAHAAPGVSQINKTDVPLAGAGQTIDRLDAMGGIRIIDEVDGGKSVCTVTILAAGVVHSYTADASNPKNRGSIVTLVEANGAKILMVGDATVNTEQFLLNTGAANRIGNMTVAQAGHHGSINTSSSVVFMKKVNPEMVVMSAGWKIPKDHLPSEAVVSRYVDLLETAGRPTIDSHETFYWSPAAMGSYVAGSVFSEYPVFSTGSRDTIYYTRPAG